MTSEIFLFTAQGGRREGDGTAVCCLRAWFVFEIRQSDVQSVVYGR